MTANLVPSHPGNANALRHGFWSSKLSPRAREVADAVLEAPWAADVDRLGAEEIGRLVSVIERLEERIERADSTSQLKTLMDLRLRASGRLTRLLQLYGLVPHARATWAAALQNAHAWDELLHGSGDGA